MSYISPLLNQKLDQKLNQKLTQAPNFGYPIRREDEEERIYQQLRQRANDVCPNEAKAKLIKEGPITSVISYTKDLGKDCANFAKAVKTGKMNDNSLGRINDLGLKLGSVLIASFLALHSKTKTEAAMKFVGGGAFLASMALWPKMFINLPARLVHGFNIGQRYVSAQGDKKDFFLDNQFLPWDAYSKEEIEKIGKRTGIDAKGENGEEKIKRKMQKTALQNRTLWMATAGFATPLMTALGCKAVEPYVEKAVVKNGFKKAQANIANIDEFLAKAKPDVRNVEELKELFESYPTGQLDDNFYKRLVEVLDVSNMSTKLKDADDLKIISGFAPRDLEDSLRNLQLSKAKVADVEQLKNLLATQAAPKAKILAKGAKKQVQNLDENAINSIVQTLGANGNTVQKLKEILKDNGVADNQIAKIVESLKVDNGEYFELITDYNQNVLSQFRGRLKQYMDLTNSVVGAKSESVYTMEHKSTMEALFSKMKLGLDKLKAFKAGAKGDNESTNAAFDIVVEHFKDFANRTKDMSEAQYKEELAKYLSKQPLEGLADAVGSLKENVSKISPELSGNANQAIFEELNLKILGQGEYDKGIINKFKTFIKAQETGLGAAKAKSLMCANFERSVANGQFREALGQQGLLDKASLEVWTDAARRLIYDNSVAKDSCKSELKSLGYDKLKEILFDPAKYAAEGDVYREMTGGFNLSDIVNALKGNGEDSISYLQKDGFLSSIKRAAASKFNDKTWLKTFGIGMAVLVGVTIGAQFLFGKIKKEYPEENKVGGAK